MINYLQKQIILLRDAPKHIPGRPSLCTVHRWRDHGFQGVPFEGCFKVGGRWFASIEAIHLFINRMNGLSPNSREPESPAEQSRKDNATAKAIFGTR